MRLARTAAAAVTTLAAFGLAACGGDDATSFCDPDPCQHGASCGEGETGPVCTCTAGFEGPLCETDHDDCAGAPCLNGGTCTDATDGFTCACAAGFEGPTCATNIDDCAGNPCLNGGTCTDSTDSFTCACAGSFEGDRCQCALTGPFTVDYTNRGTSTPAAIDDVPPGVHVTGSSTINVLNLNGLGVVGGASDVTVDGAEFLDVTLDRPSTATRYSAPFAGNLDGDGLLGEAVIEAFDAAGASLGTHAIDGAGVRDLTAMFGGARIKRFRVTANVDSFRLSTITVSPVVCP